MPVPDPQIPGWRVEWLPQTPSTNAYAAQRAREGEPAGLVVVADHQSAGRGRLERTWVTPPGVALTASWLVDPRPVPTAGWSWLPLLTGLAVLDAVHSLTAVPARLKWPNDVLVDEAKLAGILVELVEAPTGPVAVVGVGLNVSASRAQLPVETATSLAVLGGPVPDRAALLEALLAAFGERFGSWVASGGEGPSTAYAAACSTIGRTVSVELPGGTSVTGRAVEVDPHGRLVVEDGRRRHVLGAGDVVHVRPRTSGRRVVGP